jgi:uncharacterized protein YwgA
MSIDSGSDLLMTLLYSPGESGSEGETIRGITKLQKLVFLLMEEGSYKETLSEDMGFEAYDFGPYSSDVMNILETLRGIGLVQVEEQELESYQEVMDGLVIGFSEDEEGTPPQTVEVYGLSDRGLEIGKELFNSLTQEAQGTIRGIKEKYNSMSLMDLLKYVYSTYPESRERSKITDKVLGYGRRPDLTAFERDE